MNTQEILNTLADEYLETARENIHQADTDVVRKLRELAEGNEGTYQSLSIKLSEVLRTKFLMAHPPIKIDELYGDLHTSEQVEQVEEAVEPEEVTLEEEGE